MGQPEINTGDMTGIDLYHLLARRGLTTSLRHYSREWLGAAENYACLTRDRGPSELALIQLFRRLWRKGHPILAARVAWFILWTSGVGSGETSFLKGA